MDKDGLVAAARATGGHLITVEDHYAAGGIGDAVAEAVAGAGFTVHRLAVREIPRSGKPDELLDRFGISARHIMDAVRDGGHLWPRPGDTAELSYCCGGIYIGSASL